MTAAARSGGQQHPSALSRLHLEDFAHLLPADMAAVTLGELCITSRRGQSKFPQPAQPLFRWDVIKETHADVLNTCCPRQSGRLRTVTASKRSDAAAVCTVVLPRASNYRHLLWGGAYEYTSTGSDVLVPAVLNCSAGRHAKTGDWDQHRIWASACRFRSGRPTMASLTSAGRS